MERAGLRLCEPTYLCYRTGGSRSGSPAPDATERAGVQVRRISPEDADLFAAFAAAAPAADREEAFVELDHWRVVGCLVDGALLATASAYPWHGTQLADLGVLTLPAHRRRGLGAAAVRALADLAVAEGLEPQYRCQHDNHASVALARAAGFARFATWQVLDD